jgi:spore maturation protein SpmA
MFGSIKLLDLTILFPQAWLGIVRIADKAGRLDDFAKQRHLLELQLSEAPLAPAAKYSI